MDRNQPGVVKDNAATRMADFARSLNAERGTPLARSSGDAPMVVARVTPASMAAPLSEEEVRMRDEAAMAIGIIPVEEHPSLAGLDFESEPVSQYEVSPTRQTAREFMGGRARLIDFKKIQGIDLIRGVAFVDGFEIKIPVEDVAKFKRYALDLAVDFVTEQVALAMADLLPSEEEANGEATPTEGETLPEMPGNPATD